jgi:MFS family permease
MVQASLAKTIAFGGKQGFDLTTAPSTRYLLAMVLLLYVPYTLISPFVGVLIDRVDRRRLLAVSNVFRAVVVGAAALALAAGGSSLPGPVLIAAILVALACTRVLLAIKSAGLPVVLHGQDLLQGNGLSQAGGAIFQVLGGGLALVGTAVAPSWSVALVGAGLYGLAALSARRVSELESEPRVGAVGGAMRRVVSQVREGLKEVFSSPAAALGLTAFQALRMEFFGFVALVFALQARVLLTGPKGDKTAVAIAAATGALGAGLGMVAAQKLKDRVPAIRMLIGGMTVMGVGVIAFGGVQTIAGYSALTFAGAMGFFLGKISADTIMQGALPDGFRGRGFSLFDIAYNLGWIVPALVLAGVWGDGSHVRAILLVSGVAFLGLTVLIARWGAGIFGPDRRTASSSPRR